MSDDKSITNPLVLDLQYHAIDGIWTQTIDARKLHEGLEIATPFDHWIKRRIHEYGFGDGTDFLFSTSLSKIPGRPTHIYLLTLDMAKEAQPWRLQSHANDCRTD